MQSKKQFSCQIYAGQIAASQPQPDPERPVFSQLG
jgi:hypothetical protein